MSLGYVMNLGLVPYGEALELQRSLAGAVSQGAIPDTVVFLEHPPVVTIGRRTETDVELHIPDDAAVEIAETDRGGKSTFHGPGQLVCYPILDLGRHGKDVKRYVRDLEEALIRTLAALGLDGVRYDGLTGVWMPPANGVGPRKIASIGVHVSRWVTTHGYALNVDLDPAPFTEWITACGLEDAQFTTMARELGRELTVADVRSPAIGRDRRGVQPRARRAARRGRRRPLAAGRPRVSRALAVLGEQRVRRVLARLLVENASALRRCPRAAHAWAVPRGTSSSRKCCAATRQCPSARSSSAATSSYSPAARSSASLLTAGTPAGRASGRPR